MKKIFLVLVQCIYFELGGIKTEQKEPLRSMLTHIFYRQAGSRHAQVAL